MSLQSNVLRTPGEETLKAILFFQVGVGARATVTLFFRNFSPVSHGRRQRPSHTILTHMAVASLLVFLSTGIPYKLVAVVLQKLLSSLACKFVYQTHSVARSPMTGSTCILNTFLFFTLIPRRVVCTTPRGQAPKVTGCGCGICWMFSVLMNSCVPVKVMGVHDGETGPTLKGRGPAHPRAILWLVSDATYIGLLVCPCTGTQRVRWIHAPDGTHKCPRTPEPPLPSCCRWPPLSAFTS